MRSTFSWANGPTWLCDLDWCSPYHWARASSAGHFPGTAASGQVIHDSLFINVLMRIIHIWSNVMMDISVIIILQIYNVHHHHHHHPHHHHHHRHHDPRLILVQWFRSLHHGPTKQKCDCGFVFWADSFSFDGIENCNRKPIDRDVTQFSDSVLFRWAHFVAWTDDSLGTNYFLGC